jgi:hypothetical protein
MSIAQVVIGISPWVIRLPRRWSDAPRPEERNARSLREEDRHDRRDALTDVPRDVQCVDISTSDYQYNPDVRVDVTPGSDKLIRISPLTPGSIVVTGKAFNGSWSKPRSAARFDYVHDHDYDGLGQGSATRRLASA